MDNRREQTFSIWKGGAYKEPLLLIFFKFPLVPYILLLYIWLAVAIEEWNWLYILVPVAVAYIVWGIMLSTRTKVFLTLEEEGFRFRVGLRGYWIPFEDILEVSYYCGKRVHTVPNRYRSVTYCQSYTLLIRTKKKYHSFYNAYSNILIKSENENKENLDGVELHEIYKFVKEAHLNYCKNKDITVI